VLSCLGNLFIVGRLSSSRGFSAHVTVKRRNYVSCTLVKWFNNFKRTLLKAPHNSWSRVQPASTDDQLLGPASTDDQLLGPASTDDQLLGPASTDDQSFLLTV
jgi:hypothetical protein